MGTGQNRTHMLLVSEDQKRIITTNISSATISIIERSNRTGPRVPPGGDWDETVISVGKGAEGFDIAPGGKELWTANAQDGTVSVVDLTAKRVTDTLQANVASANRLKFTPDGKLVLISTLSGSDLTVLDAATRKVVKRINLGAGAAGILMQPDGSRAFVASTGGDYVAVIDLKKLEITRRLDAGPQPDGMAWAVQH